MKTKLILATLCLLTAAITASAQGGGTVTNTAPVVQSGLTCDVGTVPNTQAHVETCTFTIYDQNTETDFAQATFSSTAGWSSSITSFTAGAQSTTEAEWTITDTTPGDGVLEVSVEHTWPSGYAAGTYTQNINIQDEVANADGAADQTVIQVASNVAVSGTLYDVNGAPLAGNWGLWTTTPGATNVDSFNYIQATNDGTADGDLVINFVQAQFDGPLGGQIPIDNNIAFCYGTGANPAAGVVCGAASATGQETFNVPAGGQAWIGYRILSIPAETVDGAYNADYTSTPL